MKRPYTIFKRVHPGVVSTLAVSFLLASCAGTTPNQPSYYLLDSTATVAHEVKIKSFSLGVGPIEVPAYLQQEGVAMHKEDNQVAYAEDHLWAEPLDGSIRQVLLSNITTILTNQTVYPFPWQVSQSPDYQLTININRFGWFPENRVAIKSRVVIEDRENKIIYSGEQDLTLAAADDTYQGNVAAQNLLLQQYCLQLVQTLNRVVD